MLRPKNIIKHELIGLEAEVAESTNKSQIGIRGTIVNETKNTIVLDTKKGIKTLEKKTIKIIVKLPDGKKVKIDGKMLSGRPEKRIKTKTKKW